MNYNKTILLLFLFISKNYIKSIFILQLFSKLYLKRYLITLSLNIDYYIKSFFSIYISVTSFFIIIKPVAVNLVNVSLIQIFQNFLVYYIF